MPYDRARHGPRLTGPGFHTRVHAVVARVPAGSVTTYGDVAGALGRRSLSRHVGWALAALPPGSTVPWWRVVDASGRLSRPGSASSRRQRTLLRAEGTAVGADGRVVGFALRRHAFA